MNNVNSATPVDRPGVEVIGFDTDGNEILTVTGNGGNALDVLAHNGNIELSFDPDSLQEKLQAAMQKTARQLALQIASLVEQAKIEADKAVQVWIATHPVEHAEMLYTQSVNAVINAQAELANRESELNNLKNTNEYRTLISPVEHHYSQAFDGTFGPRTFEVNNRDDLDILLGSDGDKALAVLIMTRENWFLGITDVALANKVNASMGSLYKATERARNNLINVQNQILQKEQQIDEARKDIPRKEAERQAEEKRLNDLKDSVNKLNDTLNDAETEAVKDSVKFTADFYKELFNTYGEKAEQLAKALADQAKGNKIRNATDAEKAWEKHKANIDKKINAKDREAIGKWLESIDVKVAAQNFQRFSKGLGYTSKAIDFAEWATELHKAIKTDNWRPFFVKTETLVVGTTATALAGLAFSAILGGPVGILGYGLIIAGVGVLINDELVEMANKFWGI